MLASATRPRRARAPGAPRRVLAEQERALAELAAELSAAADELVERRRDAAERSPASARASFTLGMERAASRSR
jgi:hypothetical protein